MKEIRVMILDDEYIILDGLNSFPWEEYGCRVTGLAKNGLEGMEILKEAAPDLILSDVKMPGMDGLAFSERAKEISPEATIVILTGYDSFAYARQAISIGVKEYLLKPVDYDQLKETVGRLCEKIREEKEQKRHVEELQKHFQASLPRLRSEFASNLLHGRVQGRGELKAQEASLDICIEKYVVCIGRKSYGGGRMEEGNSGSRNLAAFLFSRRYSLPSACLSSAHMTQPQWSMLFFCCLREIKQMKSAFRRLSAHVKKSSRKQKECRGSA